MWFTCFFFVVVFEGLYAFFRTYTMKTSPPLNHLIIMANIVHRDLLWFIAVQFFVPTSSYPSFVTNYTSVVSLSLSLSIYIYIAFPPTLRSRPSVLLGGEKANEKETMQCMKRNINLPVLYTDKVQGMVHVFKWLLSIHTAAQFSLVCQNSLVNGQTWPLNRTSEEVSVCSVLTLRYICKYDSGVST